MTPNNFNEFNTNNTDNGNRQPIHNQFFNVDQTGKNNNVGSTVSHNANNIISWGVGKKNTQNKALIDTLEMKDVNSTIYNGEELEVLEVPTLKEEYKDNSLEILDEPELPKLNSSPKLTNHDNPPLNNFFSSNNLDGSNSLFNNVPNNIPNNGFNINENINNNESINNNGVLNTANYQNGINNINNNMNNNMMNSDMNRFMVNGNINNSSLNNNGNNNMTNDFVNQQNQQFPLPSSFPKDSLNNMTDTNWMNNQPLSANNLGGGPLDEANKPKDVVENSRFFNKNINKNFNQEQNKIPAISNGNSNGVVLEEPAMNYNEMDLFKAYVGHNLTKISMSVFSFPTLLFGSLVFLYRKMYLTGGILALIESAISVLLPYKFSILIVLALHILLALLINPIYLKKAKNVAHRLATKKKNLKFNQVELSVIARKKGGHSLISALIFYSIISGLASFILVRFK